MRRSKEIVILFVLLIVSASFVLWYVVDRRAKNRAADSPAALKPGKPAPQLGPVAADPAEPLFEIAPAAETKVATPIPTAQPSVTIHSTPGPASPILIALAPSKVEKAAEIPPVKETVSPAVSTPARTASTRAKPKAASTSSEPSPKSESAAPKHSDDTVELGGENEGKTIDFSHGQPVAGTSPEEKAIIEKAVKDMDEARKKVIFKANEKPPQPAPAPSGK